MEKLNHDHAYPNCPACEQVGQWKAEAKLVQQKAKLEAAEEMAKGLRWLRNENDRKKSPVELSNYAVRLINEMLTSWEKAGKGK